MASKCLATNCTRTSRQVAEVQLRLGRFATLGQTLPTLAPTVQEQRLNPVLELVWT